MLDVLAEAKNGDIGLYNRVYLEKSASLVVRHHDQPFEESPQDHAMTCQTTKCKDKRKKKKPYSPPWFYSRRMVIIRGQDDVCSVYFVIIGWKKGREKKKPNLQHCCKCWKFL